MSEELDKIAGRLRQPAPWLRLLFMIPFAAGLYLVVAPVLLVMVVVQALFRLLTGAPNANLLGFSAALTEYIRQILQFLLYNSEDKPFPFSAFPPVDGGGQAADSGSASGAARKSPAKKAAKKAPKKDPAS